MAKSFLEMDGGHSLLGKSPLSWIVLGAFLVFCLPLIVGLAGMILPAFGYLPPLGLTEFSTLSFAQFWAQPATGRAMVLSVQIGFLSCLFSVIAVFVILACGSQAGTGSVLLRWHRRIMGPLIAIPHSTIAIAILFLLAPSGWIMRLISPELTGLTRPPAFGFVPDQTGFLLIGGLMMKEIPFLLFISLGIAARLDLHRLTMLGRSLGYRPVAIWFYLIWPPIYQQMRLPILAVLAYSLSVVDMTLILGPSLPPTLSVLILQGFVDPDLTATVTASAGAVLQCVMILVAFALWQLVAKSAQLVRYLSLSHGFRLRYLGGAAASLFLMISFAFSALLVGLVAIGLWAFANRWSFQSKWPDIFGLRHWQSEAAFGSLFWDSFTIALLASLISLIIAALWLERFSRHHAMAHTISLLLFVPLFVPQISLLYGLQVGLSWARLDGTIWTVIWAHCLYILPYSWLILAPAYEAFDQRYVMLGKSFGFGAFRQFYRIRLPLLSYSFASAFVIGVAVSIALYLPTLFTGAGRIETITTEAVTLASSGARGPAAQAALLQMTLPLMIFCLVRLTLHLRFRRFSLMRSNR